MVIYFSILFLAPLTMFLFFCIPLSCTNSAWYLRDSKNQRINKKTKREEKKPNLQFIFATYNIYMGRSTAKYGRANFLFGKILFSIIATIIMACICLYFVFYLLFPIFSFCKWLCYFVRFQRVQNVKCWVYLMISLKTAEKCMKLNNKSILVDTIFNWNCF